jgi:hypothetical protein
MEPTAEIYLPSRMYARAGWWGLAGSAVCIVCGLYSPYAFIPGFLCAVTSALLFWLAARPRIAVADLQFTLGNRAIAWREVSELNSSRLLSPLVLYLKLTNERRKLVIYPGDPERIGKLLYQMRKNATFATFDGVSYKDYWTWCSMGVPKNQHPSADQPVRMLSQDDADEVERLYRQLKSVGHLDSRSNSKNDHE